MAALRQAVLAAQAEVEIPQTNHNARISLEGGMGGQHTRDTGSSSVIAPTLRLRKLIFDAGRTEREIEQREARLAGARNALTAGQEDFALEIATAYLQVARSQAVLVAARKWLVALESIESMTREIQQLDTGRQVDLALASGRVQNARLEILSREIGLADAQSQLRGLIGREVQVAQPITLAPLHPVEADSRAVESHPQVLGARAALAAAQAQAAYDALYDRPSLSAEAYVSGGRDFAGNFRPANSAGVQLVGSLSVSDGGAGAAVSQASRERVRQADETVASTRREVLTTLGRLRAVHARQEDRRKSLQLTYKISVELSARMREQFQFGRRPIVDLLAQESEVYQAESGLVNEFHDDLVTKTRLANASGTLLSVIGLDSARIAP